jgi:hypothetical protein
MAWIERFRVEFCDVLLCTKWCTLLFLQSGENFMTNRLQTSEGRARMLSWLLRGVASEFCFQFTDVLKSDGKRSFVGMCVKVSYFMTLYQLRLVRNIWWKDTMLTSFERERNGNKFVVGDLRLSRRWGFISRSSGLWHLRNVGILPQHYMVSQYKKPRLENW